MAKISPTAAAKQWSVGKTTIYRLMNDGELSFSLNEKGKRVLDSSELVRVFGEPERTKKHTLEAMQEKVQRQNDDLVQVLKAQVETQNEQLKVLTSAMERFSLQLEHQQPAKQEKEAEHIKHVEPIEHTPPEPTPEQPAKRKRSFLGRMLAAAIDD